MIFLYPDEFQSPRRIENLLLEGTYKPEVMAIYYKVEQMVNEYDKIIMDNLELYSNDQLRYYSAMKKALRKILQFPDEAEKYLRADSSRDTE